MRAEILSSLARALSVSCDARALSIGRFLDEVATELLHLYGGSLGGLAVFARADNGDSYVGCARDGAQLPSEAVTQLVAECVASEREYVVKDHALQALCYAAHDIRTSLVFKTRSAFLHPQRWEVYLWFGLDTAASVRLVDRAQRMASAVAEWFGVMQGPLVRLLNEEARIAQHREYEREVSSVLHDVRAPLGALRYSLALADPEERGNTSGVAEIDYIEEMLSHLSAPGAQDDAHGVGCDVSAVSRAVVERMRLLARQERIELQLTAPYSALIAGVGRLDLARVLSNVVNNAVRYSKGTQVVVHVRTQPGEVQIEISDDGVGIPKEVIHHINRNLEDTIQGAHGWGIGLTSSKRRVARAGGSLRVEQPRLGGATVCISLPSSQRGETSHEPRWEVREADPKSGDHTKSLVIVDDDIEHNASLGRLLSRRGIKVEAFCSVQEAVEAVAHKRVSSIVCDINMPDGGAEKLLALVKNQGEPVPVAVISGESDEGRLYRLAARGAQAFFTKPIKIDQVMEWVRGMEGVAPLSCEAFRVAGR